MMANSKGFKLKYVEQQAVVLIVAAILLVVLGWFLGIEAAWKKIVWFKKETTTVHERLQLISEIQKLEAEHKAIEKTLPFEGEKYDLLGKITTFTQESNFDLQSLMPTTEPSGPYMRFKLDLKAKTAFPALIKFLTKVETLKPPLTVSKLEISNKLFRGARGFKGQVPQIDMTLETYLKKKEG